MRVGLPGLLGKGGGEEHRELEWGYDQRGKEE